VGWGWEGRGEVLIAALVNAWTFPCVWLEPCPCKDGKKAMIIMSSRSGSVVDAFR
jgi:hypothetical protein